MIGTVKRREWPHHIPHKSGLVCVGLGEGIPEDDGYSYTIWMDDSYFSNGKRGNAAHSIYFLPLDSPLLEPRPGAHLVSLPAGLPPVPEEGLEAMGFAWEGRRDHNGYFWSEVGESAWHEFDVGVSIYSPTKQAYFLRRPPVPEDTAMAIVRDLSGTIGGGELSRLMKRAIALLEKEDAR